MKIESKISIELEVSDEDIINMIDTAGYGIGYWAEYGEVDEKARTYMVTPSYDDKREDFTVGFDDIVRVLVEVAMGGHKVGYPRQYAMEWLQEVKAGNKYAGGELDTDIMDVVIQIAIFGEVIYG
jgi:hypothetical protein